MSAEMNERARKTVETAEKSTCEAETAENVTESAGIDSDPGDLDGVAIVGMAGRFPGADGIEALWRNLRDGVESITTFTDAELRAAGVPEAELLAPGYVKRWGRVAGADCFDAGFFGLSPREAALIDPQQRLFLETAWAALEGAGHAAGRRDGRVGVYGGVGFNHYFARNLTPELEGAGPAAFYRVFFGSDKDFACTRVAHALDLRGPALTLQTACSTSLVAVCTAALHLLTHQCDLALAGGASVRVPLEAGYLYEAGGTASPDGVCRSFDAAAGGAAWGSGVGVVALRRLADSVRDGDHVFAVIKGFALNNDGAGKAGFTAPSVDGQADVIARALAMAGFPASTIGMVEAHGTATPLGDPIEVAALSQAFREAGGAARGSCALGSIKSNVGHLDAAAGVTGLIKAALAVERAQIPASLHFERANPHLGLHASPFFVNTALRAWPERATPRRAGVSSFGIGGTNAHVVLEQAPARAAGAPSRGPVLLPLSAKTPAALDRATRDLAAFLREYPRADLHDVAYTLQVGREGFLHRRWVVCETAAEAAQALHDASAGVVAAAPRVRLTGPAAASQARAAWQRLGVVDAGEAGPGSLTVGIDPDRAERRALLAELGRLWCAGVAVDWAALHAGARRARVPLPTYPFERERHWIERRTEAGGHALEVVAWEPRALGEPVLTGAVVVTEDGEFEGALTRDPSLPVIRLWRAGGDALAVTATALAELQQLLADGRSRRVIWATAGAQHVVDGDVPQPALAALWGLGRSALREHAALRLSLLDVDALPDALPAVEETQWALRGGRAFVPRLVAAPPGRPWRAPAGDGAVLVTGGLGALGLLVAEHLFRGHGIAQLVLLGRRPPDEAQARRIAALRADGAAVTIATADVSDRAALAAVLAAQPVRGIVHAAGVLDDGIVERLTPERLRGVLAPKVLGARWLDELTAGMRLDFFVSYSSVAALGAPGQASYAAANAFLDGLAAARRARGLPAVSIGWGPWAGAGMAARVPASRSGLRRIEPAAGLLLFDAALGQAGAVVYVADAGKEVSLRSPHPLARPAVAAPADGPQPAPGPRALLELVRTEAARLLHIPAESLPTDRPLTALGMDSLMGVELRSALSTRLGRNVPGSLLLDQPHVEAVANALAALLPAEPRPDAGPPRGITRLSPEPPYPPLYVIGGAVGGDELYLRELARALGPLVPCHALHYPGMTADEAPLEDVGALADALVARLRAFQPSGPCALAGHSLGGMIAFEMAVRLARAGQPVTELILLDAPLLTGDDPRLRERAGLWLGSSLREYLGRIRQLGWLTPEIGAALDKGAAQAGWPLLERMWRANVAAMTKYKPTATYHGEASFLTPAHERDGLAVCIDAWRAACPALKVQRTGGNHITMVRAPHADKTARIVRSLLGDPELDGY